MYNVQCRLTYRHVFYSQEEAFVIEHFESDRWIGLNDLKYEGYFEWTNGDYVDFTVSNG